MSSGGKSSARLVEELAAYSAGLPPLFALNPVDVLEVARDPAAPAPDFSGVTVDLPAEPGVFNAYFPRMETHLELVFEPAGTGARDWHVVSASADRASYFCFRTNSTLKLRLYPRVFSSAARASFSQEAIQARVARQTTHPLTTPAEAWHIVERIVCDLLSAERRRLYISVESKKGSVYLDLPLVLPPLGFVFEEASQRYAPPELTEDTARKLRRALLEARIELQHTLVPLAPALSAFLGVLPRTHLSPACFGGLGAVETDSAAVVAERFMLQVEHDRKGAPWYLDALQECAGRLQSEPLQTLCAEQQSLGVLPLADVRTALAPAFEPLAARAAGGNALLEAALQRFDPTPFLEAAAAVNDAPVLGDALLLANMNAAAACAALDLPMDWDVSEVEAATKRSGTAPLDVLTTRFAVRALALSSRDARTLTLYEKISPAYPDSTNVYKELSALYRQHGLHTPITDDSFFVLFTAVFAECSPGELFWYRKCLAVTAEKRNSTLLRDLLTGETTPRPRTVPVGLWNIGNTCYLNSLLQFYYSLAPVREFVIAYADKLDARDQKAREEQLLREQREPAESDEKRRKKEKKEQKEREKKEKKEKKEERKLEKKEKKLDRFLGVHSKPHSRSTHASQSNSAAPSAAVSAATSAAPSRATSPATSTAPSPMPSRASSPEPTALGPAKKIGGRIVPPNEIQRSEIFVRQLGELFRDISTTPRAQVAPKEMLAYLALVPPQEDADDVLSEAAGDSAHSMAARLPAALRRQQDVTECIENVLFQLEAALEPTGLDTDGEQEDLVKELFYGTTVQTLQRISDGGNKRAKCERFSSLLLNVGDEPTDIYDSLDTFFAEDTVDVEDGPTLRTLRLAKPPQILQIQVQRVQFDLQTYMPYKNLNPLVFDETVYLDRYLEAEPGSSLANKVAEFKVLRNELREAQQQLKEQEQVFRERDALIVASRHCTHMRERAAVAAAAKDVALAVDSAKAATQSSGPVGGADGRAETLSNSTGASANAEVPVGSAEVPHSGALSTIVSAAATEAVPSVRSTADAGSSSHVTIDLTADPASDERGPASGPASGSASALLATAPAVRSPAPGVPSVYSRDKIEPVFSGSQPASSPAPQHAFPYEDDSSSEDYPTPASTPASEVCDLPPDLWQLAPPQISETTIVALDALAERLSAQLKVLESRVAELQQRVKHHFDGLHTFGYRIHALFVHRGDVSYGHYWVYIYDTESGKFFKYNDEFVTPAEISEVFNFDVQNTATPYFLVFTRIDEPAA